MRLRITHPARLARSWNPAAATASGGSSKPWDVPRRTSAAASSSSPQHPPPPSAPSASSPIPTRENSRCSVVPARGREPTGAGSAGVAPRSNGLRSMTRCSLTRASALLVMVLDFSWGDEQVQEGWNGWKLCRLYNQQHQDS